MNLDQVARHARVSTATVSRVLNNAALVKSTTRARVMKAIEELKYSPNLHARSLAGGKSRSIGVIVSNIENPFFLLFPGWGQLPMVLLATNVLGDSLTLGRQVFSQSMAEWISRTVQYFAGRPDVQFIIRIHPGEVLTHGRASEIVDNADVRRLYLGNNFSL